MDDEFGGLAVLPILCCFALSVASEEVSCFSVFPIPMVFYELHLLISRRVGRAELLHLLHQQQQIITKHNGAVLEVRDLGLRETAFRYQQGTSVLVTVSYVESRWSLHIRR